MKPFFTKILFLWLAVISSWLISASVYALILPQIDPARVGERLSVPTRPAARPQVIVPAVEKPVEMPKGKLFHFRLHRIVIKGATVYKPEELRAIYEPYLGKQVSIVELKTIARDITLKYRKDGYILSRAVVPEQHIERGTVHIQVLEGFIDRVSIQGKVTRGTGKLLKAYADKIQRVHPLNIHTLERYVLLANDLAGIQVKTVISTSKTRKFAADLMFIVTQKRLSGLLSYNNYGTRYLGPNQLEATVQGTSLLGTADLLSVRAVDTPEDNEVAFGQIAYHRPLGTNGLAIDISADYTKTHPGFLLEPLNLTGESRALFARLSYPFIRSRRKNFNLFLGFRYLNSKTEPTEIFYEDRIRPLILGADYNFVDRLYGVNTIEAFISKGLKVFGASSRYPSTPLSRWGGRSDFLKERLVISRLQKLWKRFSAFISIDGQYTNDPLLSAEEFGFGGRVFGRGYDASEFVGDRGVAGKFELRYDMYPGLKFLKGIQYYLFYDIGKIWNIGRQNQQIRTDSGASAGAGLRIMFNKYIGGELEIAKPLTSPVLNQQLAGHNGKAFRGYFEISVYV